MALHALLLQRKCDCGQHTIAGGECAQCSKDGQTIQRKSLNSELETGNSFGVQPFIQEVLNSPGQRLDAATGSFFESRFGHDFSRVRLHTDANAAESAQTAYALPYAVGRDIVFGQEQYRPNTSTGAKLMAHDLTHVIQQSGARRFGAIQSADERRLVRSIPPKTGMIARKAASSPAPDPGWSDAPENGLNKWVTTVDETGQTLPGKVASKGVWRVPVQGLSHGYQGNDKGPTNESPKGRAVALIPNTVKPSAPDLNKNVSVDVLLHLHGHGIGYRQLESGKQDAPKVLKEQQLRDLELYQMEQQLVHHVEVNNRLIIAVLPQGSEKSNFGDLGSNSDTLLKEVFNKLIPTYLPEKAIPGRVIASGHSGGGPTAMAIANQRKRADVFLFDAINFACEKEEKKVDGKPVKVCKSPQVCSSNEYTTARRWVTDSINVDIQSLNGKPEDQQPAELQMNGTRFYGLTSASLSTKDTCNYGYWYNKLKNDIEKTIKNLKTNESVRNQIRENYQVLEAKLPEDYKGMERHERMMGAHNLEDALKD